MDQWMQSPAHGIDEDRTKRLTESRAARLREGVAAFVVQRSGGAACAASVPPASDPPAQAEVHLRWDPPWVPSALLNFSSTASSTLSLCSKAAR
jgi:hypothetical protein